MKCDDNRTVVFRGEFAGCRNAEVLDMSVLGRDVTQNLVVIIDRPADRVVLLSPGTGYTIHDR